eukprot:scaffold45790_cov31-Phaeocystis_antarctica.AAC.1
MARGWPAQLGGADSGCRAAAPTRESSTIYAPVVRPGKLRAAHGGEYPATGGSYSDVVLAQDIITLCEHAV